MGKNFLRCSLHNYFSLIHYDHLICLDHLFHIMSDQQHCHMFLAIELLYCVNNFFSSVRIQHRCRFIEYDAFRTHCHDSGNRHALLLTAGKLIRRMRTVFPHSDCLQTLFHTLPDFLRRHPHIFRSKPDILIHNRTYNLIVRILKYHAGALTNLPELRFILRIFSVYIQRAFCWQKNCIDVLCKRRFSRAIVPQNRNKIALLHIKIDLIDRTDCFLLFSVLINPEIVIGQLSAFYDIHLNFYPFPCNSM